MRSAHCTSIPSRIGAFKPEFQVEGNRMRKAWLYLSAAAALWANTGAQAKENPAGRPGCAHESAKQCVGLALEAMGSPERLEQVKSVRLHTIGNTLLMEQSYRQAPFITSYERGRTTFDLAFALLMQLDRRKCSGDSISG